MVHIHGQMVDNILDHGQIIICMVKVYIHGKMEENMKVIMLMIKNKDMVYIIGQMEEDMKDNGSKENNMEVENII